MSTDTEWINAAYNVIAFSGRPMHVNEIEQDILKQHAITKMPSMSLEVLLTKEAAMGRRFTKTEGSGTGLFSLLVQSSVPTPVKAQVCSDISLPKLEETPQQVPIDKYEAKYRRLKRTCKQMIFINSALRDETARVEKKITRVAEERRQLLKRVMALQNIPEPSEPEPSLPAHDVGLLVDMKQEENVSKKVKTSKKASVSHPTLEDTELSPSNESELNSTDATDELANSPLHAQGGRKVNKKAIKIPPINLDSNGRPVLPIELGAGLTVYSIGEVSERPDFCCADCIYPVGYCCTRLYASLSEIMTKCLYTCKVSESANGPQFEISSDNEPDRVFTDPTPEGCHEKLLSVIRKHCGCALPLTRDSDFFGLKHPIVKNLLQCCPGARKCSAYMWCKFEVTRDATKIVPVTSKSDPTNSFTALMNLLKGKPHDQDLRYTVSQKKGSGGLKLLLSKPKP